MSFDAPGTRGGIGGGGLGGGEGGGGEGRGGNGGGDGGGGDGGGDGGRAFAIHFCLGLVAVHACPLIFWVAVLCSTHSRAPSPLCLSVPSLSVE